MKTKDRFISPEMWNNIVKANKDLNELLDIVQHDHTTFDHLCSLDYTKKCLLPYYKSTLDIIDIRRINDDLADIETDKFILTFGRSNCYEGSTSRYNIVNDIQLSNMAEVEIESGYMDEMYVTPLGGNGYHFTLGV